MAGGDLELLVFLPLPSECLAFGNVSPCVVYAVLGIRPRTFKANSQPTDLLPPALSNCCSTELLCNLCWLLCKAGKVPTVTMFPPVMWFHFPPSWLGKVL